MRVMVIVKATKDSENGVLPDEAMFSEMMAYNEQLVSAGIMQAGDGLQPTSKGARVHFSGNTRTVKKGPFDHTEEQIAGFWLWKVKSLDEAIEWVKRCPNPMLGDSDIDIRPLYELEDLGDGVTPELREREEELRAKTAQV